MNLPVEPAGHGFQRAGQAQAVADQLAEVAGSSREASQARPGPPPAHGRPVMTMLGQHRVDPVAQQGPQPHQPPGFSIDPLTGT
jgi:hypothetical protein